jgi:hypothetical protein
MDSLRGRFKAAVAMLGLTEALLAPGEQGPSMQF